MAAQILQYVEFPNSNSNYSGLPWAISFPRNMTAGSKIVVVSTQSNDPGDPTIVFTDTKSNTYGKKVDAVDLTPGNQRFFIFYCETPTLLTTSDTFLVTYTGSGATDWTGYAAFEVAGLKTTAYLGANGNDQQGITGFSSGNLNTGSIACGSGTVFVIAASTGTTQNGAAPYYPTVGAGGLSTYATWFNDSQVASPGNIGTLAFGTFQNPGTRTFTFSSPSGASSDAFVTVGIALAVAASGSGVQQSFSTLGVG